MIDVIRYSIAGVLFVFFQIFLMDQLGLARDFATPYIFLLFLFMLPLDMPLILEYGIAFTVALLVDISNNTYGQHIFATLCAVAVRRQLIAISTTSTFRNIHEISLGTQNMVWYVTYLLPLIFIHHFIFIGISAFDFSHIGYTLAKIIVNTIYSFIVNYLICIVFYRK
ncbi:MAG: hypothetical protein ACKVTZ_10510 [Bacteroidia bacterium]